MFENIISTNIINYPINQNYQNEANDENEEINANE